MCFSPYLGVGGGGGGLPRGLGRHLLMQFSRLNSSKMEISETDFPDILTIQNDQVSSCKACFSPLFMCFSPYLGVGGGGLPRGLGHNPLMQLSNLGSSKMKISETDFSDILTIQNDQISYVKHVLAPSLFVFHPIWVLGGGRLPRGLGHNPLMLFSSLGSSKMKISAADFFDTLTIQNDQISHLKHVLAPLYAFFTLFGCWGWGGSQGV